MTVIHRNLSFYSFAVLTAMLLFLSALPAFAGEPDSIPVIIKNAQRSIVYITTFNEKNDQVGFGSGFFTGGSCEVATNFHVMQGCTSAEIKLFDGSVFAVAGSLADDKENDVMRLRIDMPLEKAPALKICEKIPEVGERVVVIGNPMGLEQTASDGIVAAVRNDRENGNVIQITAPISSGSSGSPVFNMDGQVIGIAVSAMVEGQNLNFAVPGTYIIKLVSQKKPVPLDEWRTFNSGECRKNYCEGLGHVWLDDCGKALEFFNKAYAIDSDDTSTIFYIGYCNVMLGNFEEAIDAYEKAAELEPEDPAILLALGEAYYNTDKLDESVKALKKSIQYSDKDYPEAHYDLGLVYIQMKDQEAAAGELKKLKKLNPPLGEELNAEFKKAFKIESKGVKSEFIEKVTITPAKKSE
ncbi:MAG TPA: trypsin-like peptidase domain-containing protein [Candidatus Wallbacteria bacterium]|nr:trypsin-like peptidase domain-containing protein [Candidatus Wallbacteria bacterium]